MYYRKTPRRGPGMSQPDPYVKPYFDNYEGPLSNIKFERME